ncbi:glutathione peroxidase [Massilia endophytica]|uniref:glutathione peroxidase n=1 Tax=Massilia endophytica TaxID=2899220 RepID=UPI001E474A3C|nr:glutathione peroxidase [Massilia endophytica]UGQ47129.1 glutathione peroxidase [Massilia endophytica]
MSTVFDFSANSISGHPVPLAQYQGKVLLIVNTASQCGFTPQYDGLEKLQQRFHAQGFEVLGFPCNQFGAQEPGDEAQIASFCESKFGVSFPMFAKVEVNGEHAHPLYQHLKKTAPGLLGTEGIKWNFTKFLIRKDGTVYDRYAPTTRPEDIVRDIEKLLAE